MGLGVEWAHRGSELGIAILVDRRARVWLALTAAVRLVIGRVRVGREDEPVENHDDISGHDSSAGSEPVEVRLPNLPPGRRRVMVEYALTYGLAVVVIVIGVGLA